MMNFKRAAQKPSKTELCYFLETLEWKYSKLASEATGEPISARLCFMRAQSSFSVTFAAWPNDIVFLLFNDLRLDRHLTVRGLCGVNSFHSFPFRTMLNRLDVKRHAVDALARLRVEPGWTVLFNSCRDPLTIDPDKILLEWMVATGGQLGPDLVHFS